MRAGIAKIGALCGSVCVLLACQKDTHAPAQPAVSSATIPVQTTMATYNPEPLPEEVWEGSGPVQLGPLEQLGSEGEVVFERQRWRFGDYDGVAWRVRAPRQTPTRVLPTSELKMVDEFVSNPDQSGWAIINGGFYERWPDGETMYRAMGVVRQGDESVAPYRYRGGSGIFTVSEGGEKNVVHRSEWEALTPKPAHALQSIDRIISRGEVLVKEREGAKMAARGAVVLTATEIIFVVCAARQSVREFEGGARLFRTSYLGLSFWGFAHYIMSSINGVQEAINMDGGISTQMHVHIQDKPFKIVGERGTINAVELRWR